jgi:hypothetical protein
MKPHAHMRQLLLATFGLNILHAFWLLLIAVAIDFALAGTWDALQ